MAGESQALEIHVILKGKVKNRFLEIKRFKGLTDDEVLRLIVNEYFEKRFANDKGESM